MNRLDELKNRRSELLSKNWWLLVCIVLLGISGFSVGLENGNIASAFGNMLVGIILGAFLPYYLKSFGFSLKESLKEGVAKRDAVVGIGFFVGCFIVMTFKSVFWAVRDLFNLIKNFIVLTMEISKLEKEVQE